MRKFLTFVQCGMTVISNPMMMQWQFAEGELDRGDVGDLLDLHFREMRAGSPPSACHVLAREGLAEPSIRFFTLREEQGILLGVGALKRLDATSGEIKSMRTHPEALGRGVGRAMLDHLRDQAWRMGMRRLHLETGNSAAFDAANHLYRKAGFDECGPFGDYRPTEFTLFYRLVLEPRWAA